MNVITSLEQMLAKLIMYLPNVVAALVILAIGGLIASALGRLTRRLVDKTGANERLARHGLAQPGSHGASTLAGAVVFWALFIMVLGAAADALQIALVTRTVERLVAYVPRFIVAGLMLTIGVSLANWLKRLIVQRSSEVSGSSPRLMGTAAQVAVIVLTSFMAARELDIGASILNTAFILVVGAFAVAFAIAFGLGSRDVAGRVARDWYERSGRLRENASSRGYGAVVPRPSAPSAPHS